MMKPNNEAIHYSKNMFLTLDRKLDTGNMGLQFPIGPPIEIHDLKRGPGG